MRVPKWILFSPRRGSSDSTSEVAAPPHAANRREDRHTSRHPSHGEHSPRAHESSCRAGCPAMAASRFLERIAPCRSASVDHCRRARSRSRVRHTTVTIERTLTRRVSGVRGSGRRIGGHEFTAPVRRAAPRLALRNNAGRVRRFVHDGVARCEQMDSVAILVADAPRCGEAVGTWGSYRRGSLRNRAANRLRAPRPRRRRRERRRR